MLITEKVMIGLNGSNVKYYEDLGYEIPRLLDNRGRLRIPNGTKIEVKVSDLPKSSKAVVQWTCDNDGCNEIITGEYQHYTRVVKEDGKTYCSKCAFNLFVKPKKIELAIKNKKFEKWCIENNRLDILARWDYDKNDCLPSEVSYGSDRKMWFKCDVHPEHHSEQHQISTFTNGHEGVMKCKQCNSIMQYAIDNNCLNEINLKKNFELGIDLWSIPKRSETKIWFLCTNEETPYHNDFGGYFMSCANFTSGHRCGYCGNNGLVHPKDSLAQYIIDNFGLEFFNKIWNWELNKNIDPWKIKPNSLTEVWWNCPYGNHKPFKRKCNCSCLRDFRCPDCYTPSLGEVKVLELLDKLKIKYKTQHWFNDCRMKLPLPFDFYLPKYNVLIEYDGEQHYKPVNFGGISNERALDNFITTKIRDSIKTWYCQQNNIKLIRIPYWDFGNIEEILIREFNLNK